MDLQGMKVIFLLFTIQIHLQCPIILMEKKKTALCQNPWLEKLAILTPFHRILTSDDPGKETF